MRFIHLRKYSDTQDRWGDVLPKGGLTIGYTIDDEVVKYSVARCNDKDHFNKRVGRMICEGRMEKNICFEIPLVKHHLVDAIVADVHGLYPL